MEGLGNEHGVTADTPEDWNASKLSNAKADWETLSASLVFWRDPESPQQQLIQFGDMKQFGVPEVSFLLDFTDQARSDACVLNISHDGA